MGSLRAFVRKERLLVALLVFAAAFFAYRWAVDLQRPGGQTDEGWRGFIDQGGYLREAVALGNLHAIPEADFAFGPGYPALAAPFTTFGDRGWPFDDPFLPANMAIWLLTVAATYLVGRRLFDQWAGLAAALGLMLATPLIGLMTLPWNTTASLGALMVTMLVALARRLVWWHGLVLGLAIALAFSARYPDALWVAIPAVGILVARGALSRRSVGVLLGLATGTVLGLLPTLYLQWKAFGDPFETPYSTGPNQARTASFTRIGHGAAATTIERIEDTSWRARTAAGRSTRRLSSVGAMNVVVQRWRAIARSASSASNFGMTTTVCPSMCA